MKLPTSQVVLLAFVAIFFLAGLVVVGLLLKNHRRLYVYDAIQLFGIIFFLTADLFLVIINGGAENQPKIIAGTCGFLGLIAGYLFGKMKKY